MLIAMEEFEIVKDVVAADDRGRVTLGPEMKEVKFRVGINAQRQILLTPVVAIPEHELWLWNNREATLSVQRGLEEATAGLQAKSVFSAFAEAEIEDRYSSASSQGNITILSVTPHP